MQTTQGKVVCGVLHWRMVGNNWLADLFGSSQRNDGLRGRSARCGVDAYGHTGYLAETRKIMVYCGESARHRTDSLQ